MTTDIRRELSKWFTNCDPQPLNLSKKSDEALYVPFDEDKWIKEERDESRFPLRGHRVVEEIIKEITLRRFQPSPASAQLFAGFRGTGKSTELSRIAKALSENYTVLWFKADDYHHMSDALSMEELALVLAAGIGEQAKEELGLELLDGKSVWARMTDFLNQGIAEKFGGKLHVLPSVKVHHRHPKSDDLYNPGVQAMEAALARRVDLDKLFGNERKACVAALVSASGGQTRDLFFLAQEVIRIVFDKELPVGSADVQRAVSVQEQSRGTFFREVKEILSTVHHTGRLDSLSETQLASLAGAMDQQLVLCYCNGEPWYDVHPLILKRVVRNQPPQGA